VDYESERKGTAGLLLFAEPLSGFRQATAHPPDTRYAGVGRVTLVCDRLNTHTGGAFYDAFPPERAREDGRRMQFVYPPEHGRWLNVAEGELRGLTRQSRTDRRIGELATLRSEIAAWSARVNDKQRAVDTARVKRKRLYPKR
jgi:hypothetical protein